MYKNLLYTDNPTVKTTDVITIAQRTVEYFIIPAFSIARLTSTANAKLAVLKTLLKLPLIFCLTNYSSTFSSDFLVFLEVFGFEEPLLGLLVRFLGSSSIVDSIGVSEASTSSVDLISS